jgi:hypothetical protein
LSSSIKEIGNGLPAITPGPTGLQPDLLSRALSAFTAAACARGIQADDCHELATGTSPASPHLLRSPENHLLLMGSRGIEPRQAPPRQCFFSQWIIFPQKNGAPSPLFASPHMLRQESIALRIPFRTPAGNLIRKELRHGGRPRAANRRSFLTQVLCQLAGKAATLDKS